jgi:2',3'-cyclic-nucleotide 2'-phosphodiesterase (5'-nucleotidase family)
MTGQEVQQLIQSTWDIKEDAYVSGVTYNVTKDAGGAVKKIAVFLPNGKPIEPAKKYRVVMGSYIATVCPFTKDKEYENTFVGCTDALIEYLKKQPSLNYKGVKRINY